MSEAMITECTWCGEERECSFIPDPFISAIYPQREPQFNWICKECADVGRNDI